MKKHVLSAAAAAVCMTILLSGCSVRELEEDIFDPSNGQSYNESSSSGSKLSGEQSHESGSTTASKPSVEQPHESGSTTASKPVVEQPHESGSTTASKPAVEQPHESSSTTASKPAVEQPHESSSTTAAKPVVEPSFGIDKKILEAAYSNMCLTVYNDGKLSGDNSQDFAENIQTLYGAQKVFSDETYEAYKKIYEAYGDPSEAFPSKQDYIKGILTARPELNEFYDENGELKSSIKPAMYIGFVNDNEETRYGETKKLSDPETEKQAFFRAVEWIVNKLDGKLPASVSEKGYAFTSVNYSVNDEGVIAVTAKIDFENDTTELKDKLHISGKGGFVLGDSFVTYDTEKLAVSCRDGFTFSMLAGEFIPDDCKIVYAQSEDSEVLVDFAEIAEKLPNLKELYMYQASGINQSAIADMKNLRALSYYVLDDSKEFPAAFADCPFKGLKNLRSLRLYGDYTDYSFLNEMPWLTDIHVDVSENNDGYKKLFNCPGITSIKISSPSSWINFDIDGIEKLSNLKKLEISCQVLDFTPLGKLKNLEDLQVRCTYNSLNVSELAKVSKLKKLHLSDLKTKDWSFLKQMKNLTELSLYYIPNIRNSDLAPLKQLTSLSLCDSGCDVAAVGKLPKLEVYSEVMSMGGDFSVFKNCTNLRELHLLGCRNGVMDFAYVQNAPLEIINCNGTDVANVELLANVKTLKNLFIATINQNIDCSDMLKKALPNCEISVDQPAFFLNHP